MARAGSPLRDGPPLLPVEPRQRSLGPRVVQNECVAKERRGRGYLWLLAWRIGMMGGGAILLGLVVALAWRLTAAYGGASLAEGCGAVRRAQAARVADAWRGLAGRTAAALAAYASLLAAAPAGGGEGEAAQVQPPTFYTFRILGSESIVSVERPDSTFLSYFESLTANVQIYAFNNRSSATSMAPSNYFFSGSDRFSGQPIGREFSSSLALNFSSSSVQVASLNGAVISNFSGGTWNFLKEGGPILAVTATVNGTASGAVWGTGKVGMRLSSFERSLREYMAEGAISYAMSQDGRLIASSLGTASEGEVIPATEARAPEISKSSKRIFEEYNGAKQQLLLKETSHLSIDVNGSSYSINTKPVVQDGLSLVVVLLLPADICGNLRHENYIAIVVIIAATCGIFILGTLAIVLHTAMTEKPPEVMLPQIVESTEPSMRTKVETPGDYKTQFMANMSHELRTPMAGIIGLMDILQCDQALTVDQAEIVSQIRRCAMALLGILNNILDLSKVEEGKLDLEVEVFDPTGELESLVEMFAVHCTTAGVDVGLDLSDDMPKEVLGDCARFRQIFANLLSNSIKFTSSGWIWIRGWVLHQGREETKSSELFKDSRNTITIYFEIEDTGLGIDPSKWETVFEHFVQGDASTTRSIGGSGLGLSLVRGFVEAMGGEIAILPKGGMGTRIGFHVVLQQAETEPVQINDLSVTIEPPVERNLSFRSDIVPQKLRKAGILLGMPAGINLTIVADWLARKGLQAKKSTSWADTVLSVEEWARGRTNHGGKAVRDGKGGGAEAEEGAEEQLLVLVDVSLMPGLARIPPDMDEARGYLSRLDYFHRRGAEVACILSPSTPIGVRNELRKAGSPYIATKPLYASKLWGLLLCMVNVYEREETDAESEWKHPLQNLQQDMLVAQGTGVHLAVSAKVQTPAGGRGRSADTEKEGAKGRDGEGSTAAEVSGHIWKSIGRRYSGEMRRLSSEAMLPPPRLGSSDWGESIPGTSSRRIEKMGSVKLTDSARFTGMGGQALLASGIEIGTEIASMAHGGLPDSLVEPYNTPMPRTPPPRRTSSIPVSRGTEQLQLQEWLQDENLTTFYSEPHLRPRPDLFPPLEFGNLQPPEIPNFGSPPSRLAANSQRSAYERPQTILSPKSPQLPRLNSNGSPTLRIPSPKPTQEMLLLSPMRLSPLSPSPTGSVPLLRQQQAESPWPGRRSGPMEPVGEEVGSPLLVPTVAVQSKAFFLEVESLLPKRGLPEDASQPQDAEGGSLAAPTNLDNVRDSKGEENEELLRKQAGRKAKSPRKEEEPPADALKDMHILVAEDTPILRRLAVTMLEKLGAKVQAVNDGQAALEAVLDTHSGETLPFDAVIMDCQMPRLDGYSATAAIRAAEKARQVHLPIIALTAHAMASDEERCLSCGMDGYLTKPANKALLARTLIKFVNKREHCDAG